MPLYITQKWSSLFIIIQQQQQGAALFVLGEIASLITNPLPPFLSLNIRTGIFQQQQKIK